MHELTKYFSYKNSDLYWRVPPSKHASHLTGKLAGGVDSPLGYRRVCYKGSRVGVHRLIWLYHGNTLEDNEYIDHIDGDPTNNDIANLRVATPQQNVFNSKVSKGNSSGVKGVYFHKPSQMYLARVQTGGKRVVLGYFTKLYLAEEAVRDYRMRQHGDFCNHG